MSDNDLDEDEERAVVQSISEAAKEKKLVLEGLVGLSLKDKKWKEILELPEEKANLSNKEILAYLKEV